MRITKKNLIIYAITIAIAVFISVFELPYYIQKPGSADTLDPIVEVDGGFESTGTMHLMTVRSSVATPIQYVLAKVLPYHDIVPIEDVRPEEMSEEEYRLMQLQMMEDSQLASKVVAYTEAEADVEITYNGVYVAAVIEDMPAFGKVEAADQIIAIDGVEIKNTDEMMELVQGKEVNEELNVLLKRENEEIETVIEVDSLDEKTGQVGIGVQLMDDRSATVHPEVHFSSGNIGGPSAGLMFALEMYNQLKEKDITHGYSICGTGQLDMDGNVLAIGGIDKKIVAADKAECEVFFAPNEQGSSTSNYEVAKETGKDINTDMEIVPVDTYDEALTHLQNLNE